MRFVVMGLITVCAALFFVWNYLGSSSAQNMKAEDRIYNDVLGQCNERRYLEYFAIAQKVGGLVMGQSPGFEGRAERNALRAAMDQMVLPESATTFVVAHDPSAKIYTSACKAEACTLEEISEPETQCLKDNLDFCYFVAVRHKNKTYCTLYEGDAS